MNKNLPSRRLKRAVNPKNFIMLLEDLCVLLAPFNILVETLNTC